MLFVNDFSNYDDWHNKDFDTLLNKLNARHLPLFVVTSSKDKAVELLANQKNINILICDGTVIKTAARVNPTYLIMQMANIKGKYSYEDMDKLFEQVDTLPPNSNFEE